jgi:hypothetical protein
MSSYQIIFFFYDLLHVFDIGPNQAKVVQHAALKPCLGQYQTLCISARGRMSRFKHTAFWNQIMTVFCHAIEQQSGTATHSDLHFDFSDLLREHYLH